MWKSELKPKTTPKTMMFTYAYDGLKYLKSHSAELTKPQQHSGNKCLITLTAKYPSLFSPQSASRINGALFRMQ